MSSNNSALQLNAADTVTLPDFAPGTDPTSWAVAAWARAATPADYSYFYCMGSGRGTLDFGQNGGMMSVGANGITSEDVAGTNIADGNWHRLIWSSDAGNLTCYLDGVKVLDSVAYPYSMASATPTMGLGGANTWVGDVMQVTGWTRPVTDAEATADYNAGVGVLPSFNTDPYADSIFCWQCAETAFPLVDSVTSADSVSTYGSPTFDTTVVFPFSSPPPAPPTGLTASTNDPTRISLAFTPDGGSGEWFTLFGATGAVSTASPTYGTTTASTFAVTGASVAVGVSYNFAVQASNSNGPSALSASAVGSLALPSPPTGLTASSFAPDAISLSFTPATYPNGDPGEYYAIYQATGAPTTNSPVIATTAATMANLTTAFVGVPVALAVQAINSNGPSVLSDPTTGIRPVYPPSSEAPSVISIGELQIPDGSTVGAEPVAQASDGSWSIGGKPVIVE